MSIFTSLRRRSDIFESDHVDLTGMVHIKVDELCVFQKELVRLNEPTVSKASRFVSSRFLKSEKCQPMLTLFLSVKVAVF